MPNAQGKASGGDLTGKIREQQQVGLKEELAKAAEEKTLATAQKAEAYANEVLDVTKTPEKPVVIDALEDVSKEKSDAEKALESRLAPVSQTVVVNEAPVVNVQEAVVVGDESEEVRVNEDLQDVTIGGVTYNFVAGRRYLVPKNVAFVLREKGRVWQ